MTINQPLDDPAILILEDGTTFLGKSAGYKGITTGEICFNTGMTGYQEVFTDPSYYGQLLVTTNVHIGNYGAKDDEVESKSVKIAGLICKNFTKSNYSRIQADRSLQTYLEDEKLIAIYDIDTRAIVRHIRTKGAMNAIISSSEMDVDKLKKQLKKVPNMAGLELASKVSTPEPYFFGNTSAHWKVAVLDFGTKQNILRCFTERDCFLRVFPAKTPYAEMKKWAPDGYFLSNGPGDPASMTYAIKTIREILKSGKPVFGICLGHQLLALACGISTFKMHHGHRGVNHPVKNLVTGKCEITSQNHGFGVDPDSVKGHKEQITITHQNLNDFSIEGIRLKDKPAFSVQYHPEASPGPHDARYLFDQFISLIEAKNN